MSILGHSYWNQKYVGGMCICILAGLGTKMGLCSWFSDRAMGWMTCGSSPGMGKNFVSSLKGTEALEAQTAPYSVTTGVLPWG
jgi:hypothetical protein